MAQAFTTENFAAEVLKSDKPVLVDFWAPWCGPCKMVGPIIEKLAAEIDSVKIGKLNVDEAREIAGTYDITSIPSMLIFKNGKVVDRVVGFKNEPELRALIAKHG